MLKVQNFLKNIHTHCWGVAIFSAVAGLSLNVAAAPQMLGLLASATPIPLTCKAGICSAELSAYCLQSYRYAPDIGTVYQFAATPNVTIFARDKAGKASKFNAARFATLKSLRGHSAVRVSVPERFLKKSSNATAYISIGNFVSLVPNPKPNDPHPITTAELQAYAGPLRQIAEQITGRSDRASTIVTTMNKLLNHLESNKPAEPEEAAQLWQKVINEAPTKGDAGGLQYAAKELAFCSDLSASSKTSGAAPHGMRYCLEMVHDEFAREITSKVWQGLGPGG
tara:strand:- start:2232 stop:3077 length:846 start_codon:yes stop_codon:yes gene_type:complete